MCVVFETTAFGKITNYSLYLVCMLAELAILVVPYGFEMLYDDTTRVSIFVYYYMS